jgi:hypothetical protein
MQVSLQALGRVGQLRSGFKFSQMTLNMAITVLNFYLAKAISFHCALQAKE